MKSGSQSCHLQLFDDCCDGLDLTGLFPVLRGFCEHMIGVIIISAEDILAALCGLDKKPTGGISVHISCFLVTGKIEVSHPLFNWRRLIAFL